MTKYRLQVDDGIPYEEVVESLSLLKKKLLDLKKKAENEEVAYMDVNIFDEFGKDITDKIFKELKIN